MKVFLAGATGVLGIRIVPLLVGAGHSVAGLTRSPEKVPLLAELGAEPVVGDIFDRNAIADAVAEFGPDLIMSQLTDLPDDVARIRDSTAANARMRREGVANLVLAARDSGVRRLLVQSVAWPLAGDGGRAVEVMEKDVLDAGGTILRYGQLYGPGTYHPSTPPAPPRIQIDAAARKTIGALESGPGTVEIVEDASD